MGAWQAHWAGWQAAICKYVEADFSSALAALSGHLERPGNAETGPNGPAGRSTRTWAGPSDHFESQVAALAALSGHFELPGNTETSPNSPGGHSSSTQAGPSGHFEAQVAPVR